MDTRATTIDDPQPLVVIENDAGQVLLASEHGWPRPLPDTLTVTAADAGLVFTRADGYAMGVVPHDCAGGLLTAREVFLGLVRDGRVETSGTVRLTFGLADAATPA